jgi:hypothetical protein
VWFQGVSKIYLLVILAFAGMTVSFEATLLTAANYSTLRLLTNGDLVMPRVEYDYMAAGPFVHCER